MPTFSFRLALLAALCTVVVVICVISRNRDPDKLLIDAAAALEAGDLARAEVLALRAVQQGSHSAEAILICALVSFRDSRPEEAIQYLDRLLLDGSTVQVADHLRAARLCDEHFCPSAAERHYRAVLVKSPRSVVANRELAWLLTRTGRRWESSGHLFVLLTQGGIQLNELLLLLDLGPQFLDHDKIHKYSKTTPSDSIVLLVRALLLNQDGDRPGAVNLLEEAVHVDPQLIEAQAWLGQFLYEQQAWQQLADWDASLPESADSHPRVWNVRGLAAAAHGQTDGAVRCYWEALQLNPSDTTANHQLGLSLEKLGRVEDAKPFLDRTRVLAGVAETARWIREAVGDNSAAAPYAMAQAAELSAKLGRDWESAAWLMMLGTQGSEWRSEGERGREQFVRMTPGVGQTAAADNPAARINLSSFPRPAAVKVPSNAVSDIRDRETIGVRFEESAAAVGIDFRYFNNHRDGEEGMPLYQTTGGGVAVIDLDNDLWPDLYFPQGAIWPPQPGDEVFRDVFYRNQSGQGMRDITAAAYLGDERYSQGVSAGDFNNDGFADLYLANLGGNRLYLNLGDGTFEEVTAGSGVESDAWTASCAIADLNGDSHPELFDVNYVDHHRSDVTGLCYDTSDVLRTCGPTKFPAAPDVVWLSDGAGGFRDVSSDWGILDERGYGLGIVVGVWDEGARPSIFVANDMTANQWWVNAATGHGPAAFADRALASGLAFDSRGMPLACMGVASGDVNGDGWPDLFVTNSFNQPSTMYLSGSGAFSDGTIAAQLHAPTYPMVGFGTQFLDADLDGDLDVIVTNGHFDDYRHLGQPFRMPAQYFSNLGNGLFAEPAPGESGPYFLQEYLGRGLARLDWNRDGLDDAVISHILDPAALLTNTTESAGRSVTFRLIGVHSERNAHCTRVSIQIEGETVTQQLTAGDGYESTNEKCLRFGLGDDIVVVSGSVQWPSGVEETFDALPVDREYLLIEGGRGPLLLPGGSVESHVQ